MGNITEHFDESEFKCPCCGRVVINKPFIQRLEKLFDKMNATCIIISSGYRCPKHSVEVGGYANDAHVMGFAADLAVYRGGKPYKATTVAYYAEQLGFGGIGIINDTYIHLDARDCNDYANKKWYGNEVTGQTYDTFQDITPESIGFDTKKHTLKIIFDDNVIFEKEMD